MITIQDVLKAFGGAAAVAKILEVTDQAVWNMKARGVVPPKHWPSLVEKAKEMSERTDVTQDQIDILQRLTFEEFAAMREQEARAS